MSPTGFLCLDFGSTFTKALLISPEGELVATASHRTTVDTDVMEGYDAVVAALADHPEAADPEVLACSSAGGGLRVAVIGQESLVTAEAGRRVALSSGGVLAGVFSRDDLTDLDRALVDVRADVVLLTGGTDGGNKAPFLDAARAVAAGPWRGPVVLAGNVDAHDEAREILADLPVVTAANVLPRIGVLAPDDARRAIREMFLDHVIGGKQLSRRPEFRRLVQGATPDVVLTGLEVLAEAAGFTHGVAVVDIGGATTDVHSVVTLDPEVAALHREVVAETPVSRTVEGDLGMRWSAASTAEAALATGLGDADLTEAAARRVADVGLLPDSEAEYLADERLAGAAAAIGVRRHVGRRRTGGRDLREIDLLIGSGGVLRAADDDRARRILGAAVGESPEGWLQPESARLVVDRHHLLAAVGLLARERRDVAERLAVSLTT